MAVEIQFDFVPDDLTITPRPDRWDLYIGIVGKFKVLVNDQVYFEDEFFNIVEFGVLVERWIRSKKSFFCYKPLEADCVLREFRGEGGVVVITSEFGNFEIGQAIKLSVLLKALKKYIIKLANYLQLRGYDFFVLVDDSRLDSKA